MKKNETKKTDAATAPSAKDAPKTPTAGTRAKKSAKPTGKAKRKQAATRAKQGRQKAKQLSGLDAAAKVLAGAKHLADAQTSGPFLAI